MDFVAIVIFNNTIFVAHSVPIWKLSISIDESRNLIKVSFN